MDKYRLKRVREIWEDYPPVLALIDVLEELGDDMPWEVEVPTFPDHYDTLGRAPSPFYLFFLPERIRKRVVCGSTSSLVASRCGLPPSTIYSTPGTTR